MRGAGFVETLIVSLVLLLAGHAFGYPITLPGFGVCLIVAAALVLGLRLAARFVGLFRRP